MVPSNEEVLIACPFPELAVMGLSVDGDSPARTLIRGIFFVVDGWVRKRAS